MNCNIPQQIMDKMIRDALTRTYSHNGGLFPNESDFKMQLYHNLALEEYNSYKLTQKVDGSPSCILHAEGKCENGNPAKADLLICNPLKYQKFNYAVDYIIELKHKLNFNELQNELSKVRNYRRNYKTIYIISALQTNVEVAGQDDCLEEYFDNIIVVQPRYVADIQQNYIERLNTSFDEVLTNIDWCIDQTLMLYGNGKQQYHGFFWCNYEHEENKQWTYPCEGDFVCQLYHLLRITLPVDISIKSEVKPKNSSNRIDLVISNDEWCIPIDVKMNWDQFKHKYDQKTGSLKKPEAELILDRFEKISKEYKKTYPKTIVIQGSWAQVSDKKERSLNIFMNSRIGHELITYSEEFGRIEKRYYGIISNM